MEVAYKTYTAAYIHYTTIVLSIHTYIYTYIRKYIQTVPTYIEAYIPAYIHYIITVVYLSSGEMLLY